jgi:hypothetical protein
MLHNIPKIKHTYIVHKYTFRQTTTLSNFKYYISSTFKYYKDIEVQIME